jgi:hypothetical protein
MAQWNNIHLLHFDHWVQGYLQEMLTLDEAARKTHKDTDNFLVTVGA